MALIDSKQIVFSGSMFIHDEGFFYGGRWPQLGSEYVIKDYVDSLVSGSVASSGSFYALTDTPSRGYTGRILFEGQSPNRVLDSSDFTWSNEYLFVNNNVRIGTGNSAAFGNFSIDNVEYKWRVSFISDEDRARENIDGNLKQKIEFVAKYDSQYDEQEVVLFSRWASG